MMKKILSALVVALCFAAPVSAQEIRAVEQWYGLYTVEGVQTVEDPSAPSGKRRIGGKIMEPKANSARIPHTPGSYFGFGYVLEGAPSSDRIPIRHVQIFPPPGVRDNAGNLHERLASNLTLNTGRD